ncbi:MAG TPA: hypothetical protein VG501_03740, partial [Rhizomicrobium sp.]|nr:hypothetical protein [Rhizomicrobium sp.]
MSTDTAAMDLVGAIDVIEETYEFMLAYAAQGKVNDEDMSSTGIRAFLKRSDEALAVIANARISGDAAQKFLDVVRQDAVKAGAAIRLVLAQPAVSSQIIDNLNASIHLRALLTDLFLL